jgi:hypothetical protein
MLYHRTHHPNLKEVDIIFLRRHCERKGCAGKIFRCYLEGETAADDNGNQILYSQIYDRCDTCNAITVKGEPVPWQMLTLIEVLFFHWDQGVLTEDEFDKKVNALLQRTTDKLA